MRQLGSAQMPLPLDQQEKTHVMHDFFKKPSLNATEQQRVGIAAVRAPSFDRLVCFALLSCAVHMSVPYVIYRLHYWITLPIHPLVLWSVIG
jgi:hypothetical protein